MAESPIHIGAGGESFDPIQVDNAVIRDSRGNPYIPGSSLKGVLRSYMETLLNSNIDNRYSSCFIVNEPCVSNNYINDLKEVYIKSDKAQNADQLIAEHIYRNVYCM